MKKTFFRLLALPIPFRKLRHKVRSLGSDVATPAEIIQRLTDISKLPPARGYPRMVQMANLSILMAFDRFCKKHKLEYFVIGGSIIGKLRHNGFIPFDDDIDVALTDESWDKMVVLFRDKLPNAEFDILYGKYWNFFKIIHKKTGLFLDIFRFSRLPDKIDYTTNYADYKIRKKDYHGAFLADSVATSARGGIIITDSDTDDIRAKKWEKIMRVITAEEKLFNDNVRKGMSPIKNGGLAHHSAISKLGEVFDYNTIYPLQIIEFEGEKIPFPNDMETYAFMVWGDIYKLPKVFVQPGHNTALPTAAQWAMVRNLANNKKLEV
ncbi:MAG: LicD family protein [Rickettsiales bacterium]|jgi:lipopolysaccharide cholinephosphotransferase|nr:LicD family protein [Rickettsiales bacterium]